MKQLVFIIVILKNSSYILIIKLISLLDENMKINSQEHDFEVLNKFIEELLKSQDREIKNNENYIAELKYRLRKNSQIELKLSNKYLKKYNNWKSKDEYNNRLKEEITRLNKAENIFKYLVSEQQNGRDDIEKINEQSKKLFELLYWDVKLKNKEFNETAKNILDFSRGLSPVILLLTASAIGIKIEQWYGYLIAFFFFVLSFCLAVINYIDFADKIFNRYKGKISFVVMLSVFYIVLFFVIFQFISLIGVLNK
ncbi:hypothetical protein [Neisseria sicca]|uniref:Uncharacterized protein n=1 Tax=Neisseria sicca VK64 TaxID=1095748 RepID=I2NWV5_NEISI|nr:hypothetical protein [Neisseria sicca]EIG30316.1 hypothetical protein HMPREF1051_2900 [Neisseria sicca VK64]